ncbi:MULTISPECIES: MerR family transcriptional regulator [Streptomyces]|uniref:Mercuric resistance operon regulatory protein n=1 Tax=Streptomyces chartreusis NRRL 3882 TaxID=1079985 RepID=A0A2N9BLS7_STRCX|nr:MULTISPECIES: MerR family transcriptional regulator [Streptomyces]MYS88692.1 MerR family transcriptional regulator [Streptomyces sp. SID5464]SOR84316.1 Mercuric resistance operon regulatory protein [Streptomyces chartreusis NRRL 3882]
MTPTDAARAAGVPVSTLRYYERRGFLSPERDPHSGYRRYSEEDVRRARFVQRAQRLGFGMGDVAAFLTLSEKGVVPSSRLRAVVEAKLADLDSRIADLARMREALAALADGAADGDCACPVEAALTGAGPGTGSAPGS